jgi:hypothetical protein
VQAWGLHMKPAETRCAAVLANTCNWLALSISANVFGAFGGSGALQGSAIVVVGERWGAKSALIIGPPALGPPTGVLMNGTALGLKPGKCGLV